MVAERTWWDDARFGLFVHYGPSALLEREEWVMHREHIPVVEYEQLASRFEARNWDPAAQARLAKAAGMKYGILISRHHDGFCLWDSDTTDFKSTKSAAGRDLVREWLDAFRAEGLHTGLYYSLLDWRQAAYWSGPEHDPGGWEQFLQMVHAQVRELCTRYGTIEVMWYDGFWPWPAQTWRATELNAMVRELQPGILINDRSGQPEDFATPEQQISVLAPRGRWETCMTLNDHWGWHAGDSNWKSVGTLVRQLVQCAAGGGNYLLNIGPRPDGSVPPENVEQLEGVGRWVAANGESIYGSIRSHVMGHSYGMVTCRPDRLYLHCFAWPRDGRIRMGHLANRATGARLLASGKRLELEQQGDVITVSGLPEEAPDRVNTVIEVEVEGIPAVTPGGSLFWRGQARF
jgi:alpha-L-fucosidase